MKTENETLLIEIGTEELPPSHLTALAKSFATLVSQALVSLGFTYQQMAFFVTARRIAACFYQVPFKQSTRIVQRKGPALSAAFDVNQQPTPAALGFARSCGVEVTALKKQHTPQGEWLYYEHEEKGEHLASFLGTIIENALNTLPAKKRMRWGSGEVEFLRPIHWIIALHGSQPLPINVFGIAATHTTFGHRVHSPHAITIKHADTYSETLKAAQVIVDPQERLAMIKQAIFQEADKNHGLPIIDDALLETVSGLVEWPVVLSAHFNPDFLKIPQEALISAMQNHQKCFAMVNQENKLLPAFILVSNVDAKPHHNIIQGNERVMDARLADAAFFFEKDKKTPLKDRLEKLRHMIFQKKLGSLYDKTQRVTKIASQIAALIQAPVALCEQAAKLCKADLLSEMVLEFPELQGIMGSYYALNDGEPEAVAIAIQESYLPRFAKDKLPTSPIGICVALADRLDTLMGIFGIGQLPTGDKDPFALRRQASAIVRLLVEKSLPLDLVLLCQITKNCYGPLITDEVVYKVVHFCFERLKAWYQEKGIATATIDAVMFNQPTNPFDVSQKLLALHHFQTLPQAQHLASASKRARNILQKSGIPFHFDPLPTLNLALCIEPAERELITAMEQLKQETAPLLLQRNYQQALILLAQLQQPVNSFFETVMVMCEDDALKQNRINLLLHLCALFSQVADISKLVL